jgi:hypothetical protein
MLRYVSAAANKPIGVFFDALAFGAATASRQIR